MNIRRGFRLGDWIVDPLAGTITRPAGVVLRLQPKTMDVLVCLAEHAGEVVEREFLVDEIWGENAVSDEPLTRCIGDLRRELGDTRDNPDYIETIPKRGYCMVAPVTDLDPEPDSDPYAAGGAGMPAATDIQKRPPFVPGTLLLSVVILGLVAFLWYGQQAQERARQSQDNSQLVSARDNDRVGGDDPGLGLQPLTLNRLSVAVLPFDNLSRDEQNEPFTVGVHDDVLSHISRISAIKVISRTSVLAYKNTSKTASEIADELKVAHIIEGGVQRAGDRVRINVQLIDAARDVRVWAETYDELLTTANIFDIQSRIAQSVADHLNTTLTENERQRMARQPTDSLAAYEAYHMGRVNMAKRTKASLAAAESNFQTAIDLDPGYSLAYAGLADTINLQNFYSGLPRDEMFTRMEPLIGKALELDKDNSTVLTTVGGYFQKRNDFEQAEINYLKAIELDANHAQAYHWYSNLLQDAGRVQEANVQLNKAVELDPKSAVINYNLADSLADLERFDEAVDQYKITLVEKPDFPNAYWGIADIYWYAKGDIPKALQWYMKAAEIDPGNPFVASMIGMLFLDLYDDEQAETWVKRALVLAPEAFWPNAAMANLHLFRGELSEAYFLAYSLRGVMPVSFRSRRILRFSNIDPRNLDASKNNLEQWHPVLLDDLPALDSRSYLAAIDYSWLLMKHGQVERASLITGLVLEYLAQQPRLSRRGYWISDAHAYAVLHDDEHAYKRLYQAIDSGWGSYVWYVDLYDPLFDDLRVQQQFQEIIADLRANADKQRTGL